MMVSSHDFPGAAAFFLGFRFLGGAVIIIAPGAGAARGRRRIGAGGGAAAICVGATEGVRALRFLLLGATGVA